MILSLTVCEWSWDDEMSFLTPGSQVLAPAHVAWVSRGAGCLEPTLQDSGA